MKLSHILLTAAMAIATIGCSSGYGVITMTTNADEVKFDFIGAAMPDIEATDLPPSTINFHHGGSGSVLLEWDASHTQTPRQIAVVGKKIRALYCQNNQLTTLDAKLNKSLTHLDCSYNLLTAEALNALFETLPKKGYMIDVSGNPGAADCDPSIAQAKGWTVIQFAPPSLFE